MFVGPEVTRLDANVLKKKKKEREREKKDQFGGEKFLLNVFLLVAVCKQ